VIKNCLEAQEKHLASMWHP